jgi:LEA14-like dessication related protein
LASSLLFVICLGLSGCASLGKSLLEQPKISLDTVAFKDMATDGVTAVFRVKVDNPNALSLRMDSLHYELELAGRPFSKGDVDQAVEVGGHGTALVDLPVRLKYSDLVSSLMSFLGKGATQYKITGAAKVSLFTIPFEHVGELKLQK